MTERSIVNTLPEKYRARPAAWSDVSAIVDLRNASFRNTCSSDVTAVHWQKRHLLDSGTFLAANQKLVMDGEIVFAWLQED